MTTAFNGKGERAILWKKVTASYMHASSTSQRVESYESQARAHIAYELEIQTDSAHLHH